jgi:hypothetical protein
MKNQNQLPNDPNVKIPDAVKAMGAAAEELHKQAYAAEEPVAETQETPPDVTSQTPSEQKFSTATQSEPVATEEKPKVTAQVTDEAWEHRYNSMKGRFDRAQQQVASQAERIEALERTLAAMQAQPQTRQSASETYNERFVTPEEEADYGAEFLNVVGKKAKEELLPIVKKYEDEISSLKAQLAGVGNYVAQDAQSRMMNTLDRDVPSWRDQNVNPEFLQWLSLPDPYSGDIRHSMLKAAWERQDAPRVAAFFKGFLAEEAAYRPATSETPAERAGKISLESLAAPGRAKTAAASSAPAEKPVITSAFIAKFYADAAAGRYAGRDEEKLRIEKQIFDAQREGRIR